MLVAVCATVLSIIASVLAAYAIVRLRYRGAQWVGGAIFLAYLVPPSILFIPLSTVVFQYGLFDTPFALILTYPTILIPFSTWLLMGYFKTIPFELEECALIDGASRWQILIRIVLPLCGPGPDLGLHLLLHAVLERIHLRADLHLIDAVQDRAGRDRDGVRRRRHLPLGLADGGRAGRLAAARHSLRVLRRALRLGDDRRGQGIRRNDHSTRLVAGSIRCMWSRLARSCIGSPAPLAAVGSTRPQTSVPSTVKNTIVSMPIGSTTSRVIENS